MTDDLEYDVEPRSPNFGQRVRLRLERGPSAGFGGARGQVALHGGGGQRHDLEIQVWERRVIHALLPSSPPFVGPFSIGVTTSEGSTGTEPVAIPLPQPLTCAFTIDPATPRWTEAVQLSEQAVGGFGTTTPQVRLKSTTLSSIQDFSLAIQWDPVTPRQIMATLPQKPELTDTAYVITVNSPDVACQSLPFAIQPPVAPCAFTIHPATPRWESAIRLQELSGNFGTTTPQVRLTSTVLSPPQDFPLEIVWNASRPGEIDTTLPARPQTTDTFYRLTVSSPERSCQSLPFAIELPALPCTFTMQPAIPKWGSLLRLEELVAGFGSTEPDVRLKSQTLSPQQNIALEIVWDPAAPKYIEASLPQRPDRVDTTYVIAVTSPEVACQSTPVPIVDSFPCTDQERLKGWIRDLLQTPEGQPTQFTLEPLERLNVTFARKNLDEVDKTANLLALGLSNPEVYGQMQLDFAFRLVRSNATGIVPGERLVEAGALDRFSTSETLKLVLAPAVVPDISTAGPNSYVLKVVARLTSVPELCGTLELEDILNMSVLQLPVKLPTLAVFFDGKLLESDYDPGSCLIVLAPGSSLAGLEQPAVFDGDDADKVAKRALLFEAIASIFQLLNDVGALGFSLTGRQLPLLPSTEKVDLIKKYIEHTLQEENFAIVIGNEKSKLSDVTLNGSFLPPTANDHAGSMFMIGAPGATIELFVDESFGPRDGTGVLMRIPPTTVLGSYETLWSRISYTEPLLAYDGRDYSWLGEDFIYNKVSSFRVANFADATAMAQVVPARMSAGQQRQVVVRMRNSGRRTWRASEQYRLGSQSPEDNTRWGVGRVDVPIDVDPGAEAVFMFAVTAPSVPDVYPFQWRMLQESVEWFGDRTDRVNITVTGPGNHAIFDSQAVPDQMIPGETVEVSVTMRNLGTTTWSSSGGYELRSQEPANNTVWGRSSVPLPHEVEPEATATFTFDITAPRGRGTYTFAWQMAQNGSTFGKPTPTVSVEVGIFEPET